MKKEHFTRFTTLFRKRKAHPVPAARVVAAVCVVLCGIIALLTYGLGFAQDALRDEHVRGTVDVFAALAPATLNDADILHTQIRALMANDATIRSVEVLAPHGERWRMYVNDTQHSEGAVFDSASPLYRRVFDHPTEHYTTVERAEGEWVYTSAKTILQAGSAQALAVIVQEQSEGEKRIATLLHLSVALLFLTIAVTLVFCAWYTRRPDR